jgi:glutathione synthase/RimK-type ligase-like ATP-grasp enzyme
VAEHKLYQLQVARELGLCTPRTIVSRNAKELAAFAVGNVHGTICKPIFHGMFFDGNATHSIYTRRISVDSLDSESVNSCPVLLQEEIPRIADVRATFIGRHVFVADITGQTKIVDWRVPDLTLEYKVSALDEDTEELCREMLSRLGLAYGAFDFIRTLDGELVFLEINPTGEWAWLEEKLAFPMRSAFVELFFGLSHG